MANRVTHKAKGRSPEMTTDRSGMRRTRSSLSFSTPTPPLRPPRPRTGPSTRFTWMLTHWLCCRTSRTKPCLLVPFVVLVLLLLASPGVQGRSSLSPQDRSSPSTPRLPPRPGRHRQGQEDPLARLSRVFGIKRIPARVVHRTPPQYMTDLYRTVADNSGLTKASGPYNANTVRSFPDRDTVHQEHFYYNVSHLGADGASEGERVLEAEFHIFKMKPRPARSAQPLPPHHLLLKVYQVLTMDNMYSSESLRLLDSRRISTHAHGWLTFKVSKAVGSWLSRPDTNYGLLVMAQSAQGQAYNDSSYIRFAQRHQHHDSKQPILVVFTDDGAARQPTFVSPDDQDYQQIRREMRERNRKKAERQRKRGRQQKQEVPTGSTGFNRTPSFRQAISQLNERARAKKTTAPPPPSSSPGTDRARTKRAAGRRGGGGGGKKRRRQGRRKRMYDVGGYRYRRSCGRYKMYVDFEDIGWSGWIISPKGYDAYHCSGECPFPLGQSQKPTNHATVQSIVHALRVGGKHLGTPCCVPNKLFSISLLYFDDDENVILKQYDDMVAASCGCH
ncbi:bone morphogenetic protein 2-like [Babylonia areolata]|uniref:bone morphogenetic protein 2-like n=1 Tax=Babylonia areolata TaxID=304850 RepID=UPI003FD1FF35